MREIETYRTAIQTVFDCFPGFHPFNFIKEKTSFSHLFYAAIIHGKDIAVHSPKTFIKRDYFFTISIASNEVMASTIKVIN